MTPFGAKLTDSQIACLRGVLEHKTSKEIAADLSISPHTVDMHVKDAMRRLNATSRVHAAKAWFGDVIPPQPLVPQSPDVVAAAHQRTLSPHSNVSREWGVEGVRAEPAGLISGRLKPDPDQSSWFPKIGGQDAERTVAARLLWIGAIALTSILAIAGLLSSLDAMSRHFIK